MVESIRDELKRLDPTHAANYDRRAAAYLQKLDLLQADGKKKLAEKQNPWILSFHDALGYFADSYGLKVAASIQVDPGKEPTSDKLSHIIEKCKEKNVRVIAVEPQFSDQTSAQAIRSALRGLKDKPIDAAMVEVDPLETCDAGELSPDLYENQMRKNVNNLAKELR
jgi:ABC-type Zn uptake system ZnuABC Zn-binding protein ZnuA